MMNRIKYKITMIAICLLLSFTACTNTGHGAAEESSPAGTAGSQTAQSGTEDSTESRPDSTVESSTEGTSEAAAGTGADHTSEATTERSAESTSEAAAGTGAEGTSEAAAGSSRKGRQDGLLTMDEAIAIVIKRVKGATATDIKSIELDHEDGRWQYEGELVFKGIEYEFEIDAQNGNILDWEIDD